MIETRRPMTFWFIFICIAISVVLFLVGQTLGVFDYELAVRLGFQESEVQVGPHGVQVNRAFGVGDTLVCIPLMIATLVGLWQRRRWALLTAAAIAGISVYWTTVVFSMLVFLPGTPGYQYAPPPGIWLFTGTYLIFGIGSLIVLIMRGEILIQTGGTST